MSIERRCSGVALTHHIKILIFVLLTITLVACGGGDGGGNNESPTVNAGPDQTVDEGVTVQLAASGSDAEVTFSWTQISGVSITLSDTTIANPSFTAPQVGVGGVTITLRLTVTDTDSATASDDLVITVNDVVATVGNAGTDQTVDEGDAVQLTGSAMGSNQPFTFSWSQISGPAVTLSNSNIANPAFTAPMVTSDTDLEFELTVTDSNSFMVTDRVIIMVSNLVGGGNALPTANAGSDQTVDEGMTVQLVGSGTDAEGAVTYSWTQLSGPTVSLSNATIANPSFSAPQVGAGGDTVSLRLTVTDTDAATAMDDVVITINDVVPTFTVSAGADQSIDEANTVQLNGVPTGGVSPYTYQWSQINGPTVTLSDSTIANPTFVAPLVAAGGGSVTLELSLTDSDTTTVTDLVVISINDVLVTFAANAGPDQSVTENDTVQLNGSAQGGIPPYTYAWSQTAGPTVVLSSTVIANPDFTAPVVSATESLTFQLTVTDNDSMVVIDSIVINVNDSAPLTRPIRWEWDFDNNGAPESVATVSYDAAGRLTSYSYTYSDDGTQDVFVVNETNDVSQTFTFNANNQITNYFRDDAVDGTYESVYTYDGAGRLTRSNPPTNETFTLYIYTGILLTRTEIYLASTNALILSSDYAYDASDRLTFEQQRFPALGGRDVRYVWDANGRLDLIETDRNLDGVFTQSVDYIYDGTTGLLNSKVYVNSPQYLPPFDDYTQSFIYNGSGQLIRSEFDQGSNGSVEALFLVTIREDGICTNVFIPEAFPQNLGGDGIPNTNIGDINWCP